MTDDSFSEFKHKTIENIKAEKIKTTDQIIKYMCLYSLKAKRKSQIQPGENKTCYHQKAIVRLKAEFSREIMEDQRK